MHGYYNGYIETSTLAYNGYIEVCISAYFAALYSPSRLIIIMAI
jgi:hypothetical protein